MSLTKNRKPVEVRIVLREVRGGWYWDVFTADGNEEDRFHAWPSRARETRPAALRAARRWLKKVNECGLVEREVK